MCIYLECGGGCGNTGSEPHQSTPLLLGGGLDRAQVVLLLGHHSLYLLQALHDQAQVRRLGALHVVFQVPRRDVLCSYK